MTGISGIAVDSSGYVYVTDSGTGRYQVQKFKSSNTSKDYDTASAAINAIYNQYPTVFGTKSGGITTGTDTTGTYYIQFFTNGTGLMAYTDGYIYFYSGGKWNPFGVKWK